ncbi:MAG: tetratricopeptide repeat protein [Anaerolineae bacterium]|nr:tetratricopeptide repeat protein [Anaerolineae bacterium]
MQEQTPTPDLDPKELDPENLDPKNVEQDGEEMLARLEQGRLCYRQGEYQDALSHLIAVHAHHLAEHDENLTAEVANDIGVVYTVMQRWQEAEQSLDEAYNLFTKLQDYNGEAQTLGNLGSLFRAKGDLKTAAANLQLSADRFHLVGDNERRAMTLKVLSMVRLSQFRFLQALAAYDAALACNPAPSGWQKFLRKLFAIPLRMLAS